MDPVVQVANLAAGIVVVLAVLQVVAGLQVRGQTTWWEEVTTVVAVEKMGASAAMEEGKAVAVMGGGSGEEEEPMGGLGRGSQSAVGCESNKSLCYQGARQSATSAAC